MWPKVNDRRNVPMVDGAITWWPSTWAVAPVRSTSASSMQSAPAIIAWVKVSSLRPGR
jgi:trans-aconitate methyltransferase